MPRVLVMMDCIAMFFIGLTVSLVPSIPALLEIRRIRRQLRDCNALD